MWAEHRPQIEQVDCLRPSWKRDIIVEKSSTGHLGRKEVVPRIKIWCSKKFIFVFKESHFCSRKFKKKRKNTSKTTTRKLFPKKNQFCESENGNQV